MFESMETAIIGLFTIGHSNHSPEKFMDMLQRHNLECIADVRSAPYSRYNKHFGKEALAAALSSSQ